MGWYSRNTKINWLDTFVRRVYAAPQRGNVMGMMQRRKGARVERAIVRLLQDRGIAAEKVSGMYKPGADLSVPLAGRDFSVEVKARATGFSQLYDWLIERDILVIKQDRREPLVVLPLSLAAQIVEVK